VVLPGTRRDDDVLVIRRNRAEALAPPPDPTLMTLVETTGAKVRAADSLHDALGIVLRDVGDTAQWSAGHALVPAGFGLWMSSGLWYPDDGIGLGGLRTTCVEAPPASARGHLALAVHDAASAAGIVAAVACPVYADGKAVALLEWYLTSARQPSPDVAHVLGHLSGVLSEVAERPVRAVPEQGRINHVREALRWVTEDGVVSRLLTC
jgi:hypothetical protein